MRGIIPIHTDAPDKFQELFSDIAQVIRLRDGEGFECDAAVEPTGVWMRRLRELREENEQIVRR